MRPWPSVRGRQSASHARAHGNPHIMSASVSAASSASAGGVPKISSSSGGGGGGSASTTHATTEQLLQHVQRLARAPTERCVAAAPRLFWRTQGDVCSCRLEPPPGIDPVVDAGGGEDAGAAVSRKRRHAGRGSVCPHGVRRIYVGVRRVQPNPQRRRHWVRNRSGGAQRKACVLSHAAPHGCVRRASSPGASSAHPLGGCSAIA